ncbi:MAG: chemotaxis protein CheW [Gammaproteobacteria bacterium]|nr:chemotaxis protein CheW [Gammaproteobacteria bacterium]MBU1488891.1 chemotaxis protein CheW [Gammaproteobacteria bacterium]MBU2067446.1 chemotaxis protein CheW [Gammaproteobacteria bacterium]MBU2138881.1 chemotaxis protein CheW [Gammaproteobacteria bacterium]MBU2216704.1 chemotaxis protein CheW [Gammaproteobacteria bacterium]
MNELTASDASARANAHLQRNAGEQRKQQYLSFMLHGRCYALDGLSVREIIQYGRPTKVPMVSPCIHGVINLRGAVVPVIDLGLRFALAKTQVDRRTCIIIVEVSDAESTQTLGILVDAVSEVLEVMPDEMSPPPAFGNPIRSDFIQAMVHQQNDFIIVLNIENALAVAEIAGLADGNNALTA